MKLLASSLLALLGGTCGENWTRPPYPTLLEDAAPPPEIRGPAEPSSVTGDPAGEVLWRPGDFARYRVVESIAVPGTRPLAKLPLLPLEGRVTLRVLAREEGGWWLEARLERDGFWFAMPPVDVEAKTRPHRWIARRREAAVRLLAEGPAAAAIRRYLVSVDRGPWLEFRTPRGEALLPANDLWDLFVRPLPRASGKVEETGGRRYLTHAGVAVTGILAGKSADRYRVRHFVLVEQGRAVEKHFEPRPAVVTLDPGLVVGTFTPRKVRRWRPAESGADLGEDELDRIPALIEAGCNWIEPQWMHLKEETERSRLVHTFRRIMERAPAFWSMPVAWEADEFDRLRSSCLGPFGFLDEPMAYFQPRLEKGEGALRPEELLSRYQEHVRSYPRSHPWGIDYWRRPIYAANYPAGVAAYDAEATPLAGFVLEVFGKTQLQPIRALNRRGGAIPETMENAVKLDAAFLRGSGVPWGAVVYAGTWPGARERFVAALREEGATVFFLWAFHDDAPIAAEEALALARAIRRPVAATPRAEVALALPRGIYIPAGLYWPPAGVDEEFGFWKDGEHGEIDKVLRPFAAEVTRLLRSGVPFDVCVEGDEALERYRVVKRFSG